MDSTAADPAQPPRAPRPRRTGSSPRRWGARPLVVLIEAVLGGVGGVYLTTASVTITLIAAGLAAVVLALVLITQR